MVLHLLPCRAHPRGPGSFQRPGLFCFCRCYLPIGVPWTRMWSLGCGVTVALVSDPSDELSEAAERIRYKLGRGLQEGQGHAPHPYIAPLSCEGRGQLTPAL